MRLVSTQAWIKKPIFDLVFIISPSFISTFVSYFLSSRMQNTSEFPLWAWCLFILGVDVTHVYSTLFRTYFNKTEFKENAKILTLIPFGVWLLGIFLYTISSLVFWRVLAYVAVFHFIRQQYGFFKLYCRNEVKNSFTATIEKYVLYFSTFYPIVYWHTHLPRKFHWFIDGDFISGLTPIFSTIVGFIYAVLFATYITLELKKSFKDKQFNIPKNLILLGTAISWYVGIIHFNSDLLFTITNVITHGVPYMALVWFYGTKQASAPNSPLIFGFLSYKVFFSKYSFLIYFMVLFIFAYIEETLWAGFVWREHLQVFIFSEKLPLITSKDTLSWLIPLLTLPQVAHYVIDGFIWKISDKNSNWQKLILTN